MSIFNKIVDIAKANLNKLASKLEDPKKIAELKVTELEENKQKAQQILVSATASLKLAEEKLTQLKEQGQNFYNQAVEALKAADEEKAKEALKSWKSITAHAESLKEQILNENNGIKNLKATIVSFKDGVDKFKNSINVELSKNELEQEDSLDTFNRMEEKIATSEHEIQAIEDLAKADSNQLFDKFSDPKTIENELSNLKKKLNL